jgi:hypothetical protein
MRRNAAKILAIGLALGLAMPRSALGAESPSSVVQGPTIVRTAPPISLDLPARVLVGDALTDGVRSPRSPFASAHAREVRLSEDGMLVVGAAVVVGALLLVILVAGITD